MSAARPEIDKQKRDDFASLMKQLLSMSLTLKDIYPGLLDQAEGSLIREKAKPFLNYDIEAEFKSKLEEYKAKTAKTSDLETETKTTSFDVYEDFQRQLAASTFVRRTEWNKLNEIFKEKKFTLDDQERLTRALDLMVFTHAFYEKFEGLKDAKNRRNGETNGVPGINLELDSKSEKISQVIEDLKYIFANATRERPKGTHGYLQRVDGMTRIESGVDINQFDLILDRLRERVKLKADDLRSRKEKPDAAAVSPFLHTEHKR